MEAAAAVGGWCSGVSQEATVIGSITTQTAAALQHLSSGHTRVTYIKLMAILGGSIRF